MDRMRTFLLYVLGILGFIVLSFILEDGLIKNMYKPMVGNVQVSNNASQDIDVDTLESSASNVNGYVNFRLTNNSDKEIDDQYVKIDLYNDKGMLSATKYVKVNSLGPGESKDYNVKFKGSNIADYKVSLLPSSEVPDLSNVINIFGYDINLSNILGLDLSNVNIFGRKLKDVFSFEGAKSAIGNAWHWGLNIARAVPWWGYVIGAGVILYYLPSGYLFGILP